MPQTNQLAISNFYRERQKCCKQDSLGSFIPKRSWKLALLFASIFALFCQIDVFGDEKINPLPDDKILDWFRLKEIADNILESIESEK